MRLLPPGAGGRVQPAAPRAVHVAGRAAGVAARGPGVVRVRPHDATSFLAVCELLGLNAQRRIRPVHSKCEWKPRGHLRGEDSLGPAPSSLTDWGLLMEAV